MELVAPEFRASGPEEGVDSELGAPVAECQPVGHASVGGDHARHRVSVQGPGQPQQSTALSPDVGAGRGALPYCVEHGRVLGQLGGKYLGKAATGIDGVDGFRQGGFDAGVEGDELSPRLSKKLHVVGVLETECGAGGDGDPNSGPEPCL
ncbi:MAG TPA: hypothetical protein VM121_10670 [Acidimicrobiales bacterium]|nr:hypothetical protein [Acidimicrobiales bacterium]